MKIELTELYQRYKACVVRITVRTQSGDLSTGAGFHIGDGYIVTARHVVEGGQVQELVGHHYADHNEVITIRRTLLLQDTSIDVAILETDFSLKCFMEKVKIMDDDTPRENTDYIEVGGHLNDWLGDEFTLSKALLMGFPPIPFTTEAVLVATEAEVNAVIDPRHVKQPCFIVSAIPRGGFSGGPAISEYGMLLGVVTESLYAGDHSELGFATVLSVEPILQILHENQVFPKGAKGFLEEVFSAQPTEQDPEPSSEE